MIQGLNENDLLPQLILILPDKEIIEACHFGGFGCKTVFEATLTWLAKAIEQTIQLHRYDLKTRLCGAISSEKEPIVCWVPTITRPYIKNTDKGFVFVQCTTYNTILKQVVARCDNMYILDVKLQDNNDCFDRTGFLTSVGITAFWKELNRSTRSLLQDLKEQMLADEVADFEREQQRRCGWQSV